MPAKKQKFYSDDGQLRRCQHEGCSSPTEVIGFFTFQGRDECDKCKRRKLGRDVRCYDCNCTPGETSKWYRVDRSEKDKQHRCKNCYQKLRRRIARPTAPASTTVSSREKPVRPVASGKPVRPVASGSVAFAEMVQSRFFANSQLDHPRANSSSAEKLLLHTSAPYTKVATFLRSGRVLHDIIHNDGNPPELDNRLLNAAIKDAKRKAAGQTEQDNADGLAEDSDIDEVNESIEERALRGMPTTSEPPPGGQPTDSVGWTVSAMSDTLVSNMAQTRGEAEDKTLQKVLDAYAKGESSVSPVILGGRAFRQHQEVLKATRKGPYFISVARTTGLVPPARLNRLHLENQLVRNNYYASWRQQHVQNAPLIPAFGKYTSIVHNGRQAWEPHPLYHHPHNSASETQFLNALETAHAEGREVFILVRGLAGDTVWPNVYAGIHTRWPNMVVRVAWALRPSYVHQANICLPAHAQNRAFHLAHLPVSILGLHFTSFVNTRTLQDAYSGLVPDLAAERVHEWHAEELSARTGGMAQMLADQVVRGRGGYRNTVQ